MQNEKEINILGDGTFVSGGNYYKSTEWLELKKAIDEKIKKEKNIRRESIRADKEQLEEALSFFSGKKIKLPEPKVNWELYKKLGSR